MPGEQMTMGDDFATEKNLELPMGNPKGKLPKLVDLEQMRARKQRRKLLDMGQSEFGATGED